MKTERAALTEESKRKRERDQMTTTSKIPVTD